MKKTDFSIILLTWLIIETAYLFLTNNVYKKFINRYAHFHFNVLGAVLSYMCLLLGFIYFVKDVKTGLLYGFVTYGVYNFTNLAVLRNYPPVMIVFDLLYGIALFGLLGYLKQKYNKTDD